MKSQQSWDNFYMSLADRTAELSYAPDRKVGAVLVNLNQSIFFSYNGTIPGSANSTVDSMGRTLPTVLHAEASAVGKSARAGISPTGATLYVTLSPCIECAKSIYLSGISRVVYKEPYKDPSGIMFLRSAGILVNQDIPHCQLMPKKDLENTCLTSF